MRVRRTVAVACTLALGACALQDAPRHDDTAKAALPNVTVPAHYVAGGARAAIADDWLAELRDPALAALVAEAIAYNADLRIAAARVDQAAAYLAGAKSPLWPQVNLTARGGGKMSGDSTGLQGIGLFAAWEIDVWGRLRNLANAASHRYHAARNRSNRHGRAHGFRCSRRCARPGLDRRASQAGEL